MGKEKREESGSRSTRTASLKGAGTGTGSGQSGPPPGAPSVPAVEQLIEGNVAQFKVFEQLVACLENETTEVESCRVLHAVAARLAREPVQNLQVKSMDIPGMTQPMRLFLSPAVFTPELWGRTFAEGLMKSPESFSGKSVVELGTGSGWITLLLLLRTEVSEVLGLDINPVAVVIARLNVWLNGTTAEGDRLLSQAGVPIVRAAQIKESDLLSEPLAQARKFDFVIGCIPQVLHPDQEAGERKRTSDEDLYDLSNYCFQQGILEDRFGLPLIARALEEAQLCLNAAGKVTIILGGRPGPAAIDAMFARRGFLSRLVWSRRIKQADDTDLTSLVKLERDHSIQFHFFLTQNSRQSVSAETAIKVLKANQEVFHDLLVYTAETHCPKPTFRFLSNLHEMGLDHLRKELDFSRMTEEQVSFLSKFSADMLNNRTIPYPHERGDMSLRERISKFLDVYCHYPISPDSIFVGPERHQLLAMVLQMVTEPGERVLLSRSVEPVYAALVERMERELIKGNDDLAELFELDRLLAPKLIVIAPEQLAKASPITIEALCDQARRNSDRWYIVDDSANFDISSDLNCNMNLRMAGQTKLPANLILLYGLIKNTVCPDLQLSFLLNSPPDWISAFDVAAELTYSRIAYPSQLYYEWLFDDLLSFPFPGTLSGKLIESSAGATRFTENHMSAARDAVFAEKPISVDGADLIRLDYGEFEAAVPDALVKGAIKGFLEEDAEGLEQLVVSRVVSYLKSTRGVSVEPERVALAQGVFPIFGAVISCLRKRLGRAPLVGLPQGSYGPIAPAIAFHGGIAVPIETDPAKAFMLDVEALSKVEQNQKLDLLWLTQPNNPSGLYYRSEDLQALLKKLRQTGTYLMADEIFFLLSDYRLGASTPKYLSTAAFMREGYQDLIFLADGISKAFAAGGMRLGFVVCPDPSWREQLQAWLPMPPQSSLRAWDTLYSAFLDEAAHHMHDVNRERDAIQLYLSEVRSRLSNQRDELMSLLKEFGIDDRIDSPFRGGLFVLARLGDRAFDLARQKKILINPSEWSRTADWCRICFSVTPDRFGEALRRLREYLSGC